MEPTSDPRLQSDLQLPSNRSFGALFVVVFSVIAAYGWWIGRPWFAWPAISALLVLAVTLALPGWLAPFNHLWMKLAQVLHQIVSPVVLGLMFFIVLAPIGIGMRLAGRDALKRAFDPKMKSYWSDRDPPGPQADDLRNQY